MLPQSDFRVVRDGNLDTPVRFSDGPGLSPERRSRTEVFAILRGWW
jgi:hypothetical protein